MGIENHKIEPIWAKLAKNYAFGKWVEQLGSSVSKTKVFNRGSQKVRKIIVTF